MKRQTLNDDARTGAALASPLSRVGLSCALLGAFAVACGEDAGSTDAGSTDAGLADASAAEGDAGPADIGEPDASRGPPSVPEWTADGFLQDGEPFRIRGVCWNPVPRGRNQDNGRDFAGFVDQDAALMASIGINAVRTYTPILDEQVLDTLYARGIFVIQQVYGSAFQPLRDIDAAIAATKDHPAILMWEVGNEWNYNGIFSELSFEQAVQRIAEATARIKRLDNTHPVSTSYGELPSPETLTALAAIDVWGLNVYRGLGFGDLFTAWQALSGKPFYLAEFGADAYDATLPGPNPQAQADATFQLTQQIRRSDALGGTIFEFADEWWKDATGTDDTQDTGGIAPGGGPHPDATFNEEWWGLVDIDRNPRPAFFEYRRAWFD